MKTPLRKSPTAKISTDKWGPSEWFGHDIQAVSDPERLQLAEDALLPNKVVNRPCPFLEALTAQSYGCSKSGGVCSVQRYSLDSSGQISLLGHKVAICPSRLVSQSVLAAIAKKVLNLDVGVILVKEVPYSVSLTKTNKSGEPAAAGRIDWLLVDDSNPNRFCAVETQSVYMSGKSQDATFAAFVAAGGQIAMPPDYRHPDYKSSVPKRLAPQLESKARHLSSTSRKTVVLVDEFVRANMSALQEVAVPNAYASDPVKAEQHKLNGCEVIFAIVTLTDGSLTISEFLYCSISSARDALNAVAAMSHSDFEKTVVGIVRPTTKTGKVKLQRADKVFKLS